VRTGSGFNRVSNVFKLRCRGEGGAWDMLRRRWGSETEQNCRRMMCNA
jgi:hypothetical protein